MLSSQEHAPEEVLTVGRPSSPTGSQRRDGPTNGHKKRALKRKKNFSGRNIKSFSTFSLRGLFALIILLYNKDVSAFGLAVQLRNVLFDIDVVLERPLDGHVIAGE